MKRRDFHHVFRIVIDELEPILRHIGRRENIVLRELGDERQLQIAFADALTSRRRNILLRCLQGFMADLGSAFASLGIWLFAFAIARLIAIPLPARRPRR